MQAMEKNSEESPIRLLISFRTSLVIPLEEGFEKYDDNYVRRFSGVIEIVVGEQEERTEIGEIEIWYIDGTRAQENNLDISNVCDFLGHEEHEYAESVYTEGELDSSIVEYPVSQDVLALRGIAILPEYRGRGYGLKTAEKIIETMGSQCGAVLLRPAPVQFSAQCDNVDWMQRMDMERYSKDEQKAQIKLIEYWLRLGLRSTKNEEIYCIVRDRSGET